ncbi:MAG: hypothetical protein DCF31_17475 [Alphaproteobacteria bacterium]|nr:MAG: hypothetical protein DCF31_17475 [Alphaproteobacteria bacterium]
MAFASVARTFNQRQVAGVFDAVEATATGDTRTVIDALVFASTDQALTGFDTMSGEIHASVLAAGVHQGEILTDAMHNRVRATGGGAGGAAGLRLGAWLSGGLIDGRVEGDGNGARLDGSRRGITGGIDFADAATGTLLGIAGGWSSGDVTSNARRSRAELDSWHLGAYGRVGTGRTGLTLAGSFAWSSGDADVTRRIAVNTINRTATARYTLKTTTLAGEARYGFGLGTGFSIGPIANVAHARVSRDGFAESGALSLGIIGGDDSDSLTSWGVGGFANWVSGTGRIDVSVAYDRADGDVTETRLALAGAPGNAYVVRSPGGGDNAVKASITGDVALGGGWGLGATYRGRLGGDFTAHSALVTLHWRR